LYPPSQKPLSPKSDLNFGSSEKELERIGKPETEIEPEIEDFDTKLIILASMMAEQCIMESKKVVLTTGNHFYMSLRLYYQISNFIIFMILTNLRFSKKNYIFTVILRLSFTIWLN